MTKIARPLGTRLRAVSIALAFAIVLVPAAIATRAQAQSYKVLYTFTPGPGGGSPYGGLIRDAQGNLYGTGSAGGNDYGTVFKLDKTGKETVLYSFTGSPDGRYPMAGFVRDAAGNLYGTTYKGGTEGWGTVFKVAPTGGETVLYDFTGEAEGGWPWDDLVRDAQGNLHGTTANGGDYNCGDAGCGAVFELRTTGTVTALHTFAGSPDGSVPYSGLVRDAKGNLYGTTYGGGGYGYGTVFKVAENGKETVLHSFTGSDGAYPYAGLVRDAAGNLYGTTYYGGARGYGTVFKVTETGKESVLYSFAGGIDGPDGALPCAGLVLDAKGNLYGTTIYGGTYGIGTVFKVAKNGKETVLHSFTHWPDGSGPYAGLLRDAKGNLYGTTVWGGSSECNCGVVFELTP